MLHMLHVNAMHSIIELQAQEVVFVLADVPSWAVFLILSALSWMNSALIEMKHLSNAR